MIENLNFKKSNVDSKKDKNRHSHGTCDQQKKRRHVRDRVTRGALMLRKVIRSQRSCGGADSDRTVQRSFWQKKKTSQHFTNNHKKNKPLTFFFIIIRPFLSPSLTKNK